MFKALLKIIFFIDFWFATIYNLKLNNSRKYKNLFLCIVKITFTKSNVPKEISYIYASKFTIFSISIFLFLNILKQNLRKPKIIGIFVHVKTKFKKELFVSSVILCLVPS